jgi:hypothetical protein
MGYATHDLTRTRNEALLAFGEITAQRREAREKIEV